MLSKVVFQMPSIIASQSSIACFALYQAQLFFLIKRNRSPVERISDRTSDITAAAGVDVLVCKTGSAAPVHVLVPHVSLVRLEYQRRNYDSDCDRYTCSRSKMKFPPEACVLLPSPEGPTVVNLKLSLTALPIRSSPVCQIPLNQRK
jgi:hypothetical protein